MTIHTQLPEAAPAEVESLLTQRIEEVVGVVNSGKRDLLTLRTVAEETIQRQLEVIEGVAAVQVNGGLEEEIQVEIDAARLAQLGISLRQVVERLQQETASSPAAVSAPCREEEERKNKRDARQRGHLFGVTPYDKLVVGGSPYNSHEMPSADSLNWAKATGDVERSPPEEGSLET